MNLTTNYYDIQFYKLYQIPSKLLRLQRWDIFASARVQKQQHYNCNCPGPFLDLEGGLFTSSEGDRLSSSGLCTSYIYSKAMKFQLQLWQLLKAQYELQSNIKVLIVRVFDSISKISEAIIRKKNPKCLQQAYHPCCKYRSHINIGQMHSWTHY